MEVRLTCTFLTLWMCLLVAAREDIKNCKPPAIIKQARRTVYIQEKGGADLMCSAVGDGPLRYIWLKDDKELDPTTEENKVRMTIKPGFGTLVINPAETTDAGVYQCKVQNQCGTSLSVKTQVLYAHALPFLKKREPEKEKAMLGKHLKLSCTPPPSIPEATVSWSLVSIKNDENGREYEPEEITTNFNSVELGRRITMDYSGNLYFVSVLEGDAQTGQKYVCMTHNSEVGSFNQGEDKVIEIFGTTATPEPTTLLWRSDKDVLALEGGSAKFKCIFAGNPTPKVRWRRIDGGMLDEKRMKPSTDEHEFVIRDVKAEDAGEYECSGENALVMTVLRESFTLSVESRPRWTKQPDDFSVGVEDNVTFVCEVDAIPKANIQWYINGVPIENAPPAKNRQVRNNGLVFTNLTQDDSQVIQCNASNIHGYLWADVFLQVEAMKPTILSKPTEQKVAVERNVTIPCGVEGKPRPEVLWYKGDQKLQGSHYKILPSGDLQIMSVMGTDSGNYLCIAKNRFGEAEAQGSLVVREKTMIYSRPEDDKVNYGETAIFKCGAMTDKEEINRLQYIWLKDGIEVDRSDPRVKINGGDLTINATNSKDTGDYTCIASNDLDSDRAVATLEVKAPPDAPYNLSIVSCGSSDADLEWEFRDEMSNFSPLQEFVVEFNTSHDPDVWKEAARVTADRRRLVYKMSPWASYNFRVRARNLLGMGEPSERTQTQCRSAESRPYRNPNNVQTVGDKTGWLVIEWEPMQKLEHNSADFRYEVTWRAEGDANVNSAVVRDWEQDRFEVEVDNVYKPYSVTVKAVNSLGAAMVPPTEVKGFSGEASPRVIPENFELDPDEPVTSTSAGFRWDPVDTSPESMNGKFQGYKIRYWKKDLFNSTLHEELIIIPEYRFRRAMPLGFDDKIKGKVSGLPSFSEIEADVVAVNTYFSSNGSNVVNFSTPEGVPSRVKSLEALFRGSSHFLIEWGSPIEKNGILTGYEVGYQKIVGLNIGDVINPEDLPPTQHRFNIDGLDPDSMYRISVAAKTAQGRGELFYIDVHTTDELTDLAEPKILKVEPGESDANVTFSLTQTTKGVRTGSVYFLEYRKIGDHSWDRDNEGATDHFWLKLDKLEPATSYEVRVVSVPKKANTTSQEFKPSVEARFVTTGVGTKKGSVLSAGWFLGMMVAIAVLLLILIIVCIVKRNRGKEYKFPPEKDTVDETPGHFSEMAKSEKNGVNASASFERDPEKVPLEEETDSLEDYGDVDPTKFNEDGSFIGQYGDMKPGSEAPNASAMSSIV